MTWQNQIIAQRLSPNGHSKILESTVSSTLDKEEETYRKTVITFGASTRTSLKNHNDEQMI